MSDVLDKSKHKEFLLREPVDTKIISGIGHLSLDVVSDATNPFIVNEYDFQEGFYNGEFKFQSPIDFEETTGTPEIFGRQRIVAVLLDAIGSKKSRVLDLGAGTLDIARTIPLPVRSQLSIINSDISGPWSATGLSALERGSKNITGFKDIYNVQYDFNSSKWPFREASFDYIVSNMALHHIKPELKQKLLQKIYSSLAIGGSAIFTDVFNKDESGAKFTEAGLRGPEECGGYIEDVSGFINMAREAGFTTDENALRLASEHRNHLTPHELSLGIRNIHTTMAINKAIWFMELQK